MLQLNVPEPIYRRLATRAVQSRRSVEAETIEVLNALAPVEGELEMELADISTVLSVLDRDALQRTAGEWLPEEVSARIESLHLKKQRDGLTEPEAEELGRLMRQFDRHVLIRAQAAVLLKERGEVVSGMVQP